MILSNIFQLKQFLLFFFIGLIIGLIYGILNITHITKKYAFQIIVDFISTITITFTYIIAVNLLNNGVQRVYIIVAYALGFLLERITIGKMFAKGYNFMYTNIVKVLKKFASTKIGKVILK